VAFYYGKNKFDLAIAAYQKKKRVFVQLRGVGVTGVKIKEISQH
jgi:hypothetical protein